MSEKRIFDLFEHQLLPASTRVLKIVSPSGKGRVSERYLLKAIRSDWGDAFALAKIGGKNGLEDAYHIMLNGRWSHCECMGHLRHHKCKHLEALRALRKRLPQPERKRSKE